MIAIDFEYYRPTEVKEAVELFRQLDAVGKQPVYYAGGTEIITMARTGKINTQAVIDIKYISECNQLDSNGALITTGTAVSLTGLGDSGIWPMLGKTARRIAEHTSRNKITLGGNICGGIQYKEMALPLLLCGSLLHIASAAGMRDKHITDFAAEGYKLQRGELLVNITFEKEYSKYPYIYIKKTKFEKVDYPLVSAALIKKDGLINAAVCGIYKFPYRAVELEESINAKGMSPEQRAVNAVKRLNGNILADILGSAEYRRFVLKNILEEGMTELEGVN